MADDSLAGPAPHAGAGPASNLRAIVLMTVSMAAFAVEDLMIVTVSRDLPTGQILMILGLCGTAIFGLLLRRSGQPVLSRDLLHPGVMLRNASEAAVAVCIVLGLSLVPLSVFASILQALPLAVTLGAALFLGERVGWRRWAALTAGFLGVLVILRPGTGDFDPDALLAVASVALLAARDLATRRLPGRVASLQVACWGFAAIVPAGGLLMLGSGRSLVMPSPGGWAALAAAVLFGTLAYLAIVQAVRMAETAVVAPFRYTRLVVAMGLAIVVLGERPGPATLGGAALIIASGLYAVLRESRRGARAVTEP